MKQQHEAHRLSESIKFYYASDELERLLMKPQGLCGSLMSHIGFAEVESIVLWLKNLQMLLPLRVYELMGKEYNVQESMYIADRWIEEMNEKDDSHLDIYMNIITAYSTMQFMEILSSDHPIDLIYITTSKRVQYVKR
jgi:hypothetical protein